MPELFFSFSNSLSRSPCVPPSRRLPFSERHSDILKKMVSRPFEGEGLPAEAQTDGRGPFSDNGHGGGNGNQNLFSLADALVGVLQQRPWGIFGRRFGRNSLVLRVLCFWSTPRAYHVLFGTCHIVVVSAVTFIDVKLSDSIRKIGRNGRFGRISRLPTKRSVL